MFPEAMWPSRRRVREVGPGRVLGASGGTIALGRGGGGVLTALRYAPVTGFFFPLVIAATWVGGYWPVAYLAFAVGMYVLIDNCTPPLLSTQSAGQASVNGVYLFLHIPLSIVLLCIYLFKVRLMSTGAESAVVSDVGLVPFSDGSQVMAAGFAVGVHCGINTVAAHEMMHRSSKFWRACSRVLLVMVGDAQFQEAHLYGHHAAVGTPADPATARRGESLYRFFVRSSIGQWREAYAFEAARLRRRPRLARWVRHRVLRGNLATLSLLAAATWLSGAWGAVAYLIVMFEAKASLEVVNYIQHYGLTRDRRSKVEAHHSWDCDARGSSMYMYNLTRHADHHAAPRRAFWELEARASPYRLPHGYMLAMLIALFPRLWFRYVDRQLEQPFTHG